MSRIARNFSAGATGYDSAARVQPLVAANLVSRLRGKPKRILEIGCGTGGLSIHLARLFPEAELVLTDIAEPMLKACQRRLGSRATFRLMDGERPAPDLGAFDLIVSSLAMQWFSDLTGSIRRFAGLLMPGGELAFATLGSGNFPEWRGLLAQYEGALAEHRYPDARAFPWPDGLEGILEEAFVQEEHASGTAFLKALKMIGAGTPPPGYKPLSPAEMRRVLAATANGFTVTYHILYGSLTVG